MTAPPWYERIGDEKGRCRTCGDVSRLSDTCNGCGAYTTTARVLLCYVCHTRQAVTPSGVVCVNGHGGAPSHTAECERNDGGQCTCVGEDYVIR